MTGRRAAGGSGAVAAIDCGTNSTRLLVAAPDGATLDRRMVITRLGQGVDRAGRLAPEAIGRTTEVLAGFRAAADGLGAPPARTRAVATSAVRDAANGREFLAAARAACGVTPEILTGGEEGRLSYAGATADLDGAAGPYLVVDIGGGSTELVGADPDADGGVRAVSLDIGCVRLTERFLATDPPSPGEMEAARRHVVSVLDTARSGLGESLDRARLLVGLAGTVSAAALLDAGGTAYRRDLVHHRELEAGRLAALLARLAALPLAGRRRVPGLEPERADVIVGGLIVLSAVLATFGFDRCLSSEADILDGLVLGLLEGP